MRRYACHRRNTHPILDNGQVDPDVASRRWLAESYVADPRFAKHYDEVAPGLAAYVRDAIVALYSEETGSSSE